MLPDSFAKFDPSRIDPQTAMEMAELLQTLSVEEMNLLHSTMHNVTGGTATLTELQEAENRLPPDFIMKASAIIARSQGPSTSSSSLPTPPIATLVPEGSIREARLIVLRSVAAQQLSPEEAEKVLFPD